VDLRDIPLPTLVTRRLALRRLSVEDADRMFAYLRDPALTEFVSWERHASIERTVLYLMTVEAAYRDGLLEWAVTTRRGGRLVGTCGFTRLDLDHARGEIGYTVGRRFSGRGYATEAAAEVVRYGFEELGLHRIEAQCVVGNAASARVLEKIGMTFEGVLAERAAIRGGFRDVQMFARLGRGDERAG
jgi:[ribosomal protein S5]-alanine N-acetyltransferase